MLSLFQPICTNRLQPLDLSINKAVKEFLRGKFFQVFEQRKGQVQNKSTDLRLSIMKPLLGARWMVDVYNHIKSKPDMIKGAFKAAGIEEWKL